MTKDQNSRQQSIDNFSAKIAALHPDVDVIEVVPLGHGVFAAKISTPIGTYLPGGRTNDWIDLVSRDIEAVCNFACSFCETDQLQLNVRNVRFPQVNVCNSCFLAAKSSHSRTPRARGTDRAPSIPRRVAVRASPCD